jgi:hypothetical protein
MIHDHAYGIVARCWYKDGVSGHVPKPTEGDLAVLSEEYKTRFVKRDPVGEPIPVSPARNVNIDDGGIPSNDKIECALKGLRRRKSSGASGIRVEDLLKLHTKNGDEWAKVKQLILRGFNGDAIPQAFMNSILVLIPKPGKKNKLRPIAFLLEGIYKLVLMIINTSLNTQIRFHDAIHGFCAGRGTSNAIIEAKLWVQLSRRQTKFCTKSS